MRRLGWMCALGFGVGVRFRACHLASRSALGLRVFGWECFLGPLPTAVHSLTVLEELCATPELADFDSFPTLGLKMSNLQSEKGIWERQHFALRRTLEWMEWDVWLRDAF